MPLLYLLNKIRHFHLENENSWPPVGRRQLPLMYSSDGRREEVFVFTSSFLPFFLCEITFYLIFPISNKRFFAGRELRPWSDEVWMISERNVNDWYPHLSPVISIFIFNIFNQFSLSMLPVQSSFSPQVKANKGCWIVR